MASQVEGASPTTPYVGYYKGQLNLSKVCQTGSGIPNDISELSILLPIFLSCDNPGISKIELERIAKFIYFNPGKEHVKKIYISDCGSSKFRSYCSALNISCEGGSVVSFIPQISFGGDLKENERHIFNQAFSRVINLVKWEGHDIFPAWFSQNESVALIGERDKTNIEEWATETSKIILTAFHGGSVPGYKQVSKPFDLKLEYLIFEGGAMSKSLE